jgi:hypothetical protein
MNVRQLIALLRTLPPSAEVCTWDAGISADVEVEQVVLTDGHKSPVVVLGMEIVGLEGRAVWARDEARLGQLLGSLRKAEQARVERTAPVDIIEGRKSA